MLFKLISGLTLRIKKANELEDVLENYRVHLTHRDTYEKFFVDHTLLNILFKGLDNIYSV